MSSGSLKSAIVTGGGSGIGRAIAEELASRGFALTLVGRREDALRETAERIAARRSGSVVRSVSLDVAEPEGHGEVVADHIGAFGGLDGLVVSSGVYRSEEILELSASDWGRVFATNFEGTRRMAEAVLPGMLARGSGRIVLIGSVVAAQSEPGSAAYSASKAAVHALARSIAVEYGARGISVNTIAPGWVNTAMASDDIVRIGPGGMRRVNPMGRAAEPEEIGNLAAYLVDEAPPFLNGATIAIDGGQSIVAPAP